MIARIWPAMAEPKTAAPQIIVRRSGSGSMATLRSATPGASIGYRIGGDPAPWRLYVRPVALARGERIETKAVRYGYAESEDATAVAR